jgi:hypothetical protein
MPSKKQTRNETAKRYVPSWEADHESWRVEAWIIIRLVDHGAARPGEITSGITTFAIRRDRIRQAITAHALADRPIGTVGKTKKREETFGSIFAKFYLEPLIPKEPVCSNSNDAKAPSPATR